MIQKPLNCTGGLNLCKCLNRKQKRREKWRLVADDLKGATSQSADDRYVMNSSNECR